jgi:hypothetical protein
MKANVFKKVGKGKEKLFFLFFFFKKKEKILSSDYEVLKAF